MRLLVEHVGRIDQAEIEVRPLTFFIGENNTNKTWTAHALFYLLERLRIYPRQRPEREEIDPGVSALIDARAATIVAQAGQAPGAARFEIARRDLVDALGGAALRLSLAGTRRWLSALGVSPGPAAQVTLAIDPQELVAGVASRLRLTLSLKPFLLETELDVAGAATPVPFTDHGAFGAPTDVHAAVRQALLDLLLGLRRRARVLPVEREHLVQVFPWLLSIEDRIPMPRALVDFCYLMNQRRLPGAEQPGALGLGAALHDILGGSFRFPDAGREPVFAPGPGGGSEIPVKAAASLAKSLAGLDVFLWSAGPGDIIVIDEPEMNAHPSAQVALMELFALMIRAGMHLVVVTHSPYLVDHLSTLLEVSRLSDEQRRAIAKDLALGQGEAYLRPSEVAVWEFGRDGQVTSKLDEETGAVDWSTFTAVSDRESVSLSRILKAERLGDGSA